MSVNAVQVYYIDAVTGARIPVDNGFKPLPIGGSFTLSMGTIELGWVFLGDQSGTHFASITAAGALQTDGSAVTQPVSALALPLPGGASTASGVTQVNTSVGNLNTSLGAKLDGITTALGTPFQAGGSVGNTRFIADAGTNLNTSSLNLEATQSGFKSANHTDLAAISTALGTPMQATGGTVGLVAGAAVIGHVINDESTAVIGHVIVDSGTIALPSNAAQETGGNLASLVAKDFATSAKQDTGNTTLTSLKTALGSPLQAGTVTTLQTPMSGPDSDGLVDAVNKMTLLLMSIDMRLQELPLRINNVLNAGTAMNYRSADDFYMIREDLANLVYNN